MKYATGSNTGTIVPSQLSADKKNLGARSVLTVVFLAICSLVFLGSAIAGMYFNLRPSSYSSMIQRATAICVSISFFCIGLVWARLALRIARRLESP